MQPQPIQRLARDERLARHVGFWWGLAEGIFFFIVPDVYISFATLYSLRAGAIAWFFSIAGSVVAVIVIYVLFALGVDYLSFLAWIPGISESLIQRLGQQVAAEGLAYSPLLVLAGVPLKLWVAQAFALDMSLGSVVLWTVFARIVRIAPTFVIVAAIRLLCGRRIDARARTWCALLGIFWLMFYAFYFVHMSRA